jgi:hypothetical protein
MTGNSDDTIVVRRSPARLGFCCVILVTLVFSVAGGAALFAWNGQRVTAPAAVPAALPGLLPLATEAEILSRVPIRTEFYRFSLQPEVVVLHFVSLGEQASMFNRAAALLERAGYPHDRLVDDDELDRRIRASGDTPERVYYGHDYQASELVRFFVLADRAGTTLTTGEVLLRRLLLDWGWESSSNAALISLVSEDQRAGIDQMARATILRHELSHGVFFTDPNYARFARDFWNSTMTDAERGRFRVFLASEGYDTDIEDLMVNETQAYLIHTPPGPFFPVEVLGIPAARIDALRALLVNGMPPGWLHDLTVQAMQATGH